MKPVFLFYVSILVCSCKYQAGNPPNQIIQDTTAVKKDTITNTVANDEETDDSGDDPDSIEITFNDLRDTLIYGKTQFANIKTNYQELTERYPENPDEAFAQTTAERKLARKEGIHDLPTFSSEVGIDEYYMLYAYFLKKRNGGQRYQYERKILREIFRDINSIHFRLQHGGTGFGHMLQRIEGYAEYGVYQYREYADDYNKKYQVNKQKQLSLTSLKQFISDEAELDSDTPNAYKNERKKDIFSLVDKLDLLISNYFYLNQAEEFEYKNYR